MKRFLPYFAYLKEVRRPFLIALFFGVIHGLASGFGLPFATEKVFPALFSNPDPSIWTLGASPRTTEFTVDYNGKIKGYQRLAKTWSERTPLGEAELEAQRIGDVIAHLEASKEAERLEASYIGRLGKILEPVLRPLGFDWRVSVALVTGFVAERVVDTLKAIDVQKDDAQLPRAFVVVEIIDHMP